jgi:hypothetical protein
MIVPKANLNLLSLRFRTVVLQTLLPIALVARFADINVLDYPV